MSISSWNHLRNDIFRKALCSESLCIQQTIKILSRKMAFMYKEDIYKKSSDTLTCSSKEVVKKKWRHVKGVGSSLEDNWCPNLGKFSIQRKLSRWLSCSVPQCYNIGPNTRKVSLGCPCTPCLLLKAHTEEKTKQN